MSFQGVSPGGSPGHSPQSLIMAGYNTCICVSWKAGENQPDEGERAWLPATLEECLEALGILLVKSGAEPSGAFSFWRLARAN